MIKFIFIATNVILLTSCAHTPPFQKINSGVGYKIENLEIKNSFKVTLKFSFSETTSKYLSNYAFRAVGEECLTRGLNNFESTKLDENTFNGYCFANKTYKALAVTFEESGLNKTPIRFIVEDLNNKTFTLLKINDEIINFDNIPLTSMTQIKHLVFSAADKKRTYVSLKIKRTNSELIITEPLAEFAGSLGSKEDLDAVRKIIK